MAVGAGAVGQGARHTRDIRLGWVALSDDGPSWSEMSAAGLDALANGDPGWRLEYPALRLDGDGRLHLAASGFHEGGTLAVVASSDDGRSWDERGTVDLPYELMPHLGPVWIGERALWATVNVATQDAWLCAGEPGIEPICVDAGTQRISRLAVAQDELHALVDVGVGQWEASSWPLSEFGGR